MIYNSSTAAHIPANVTGYNFVFTAQAGNPALRPETAWNYDASYEYYFSKSSMFSADLFLKELQNSISYGESARNFTNNGSTQTVYVMGPVNNKDGGELWGFELNYQAFFDFLPAPFDGLGTQLNYTHTHQAGINNADLATEPGYIAGSTVGYGGGLRSTMRLSIRIVWPASPTTPTTSSPCTRKVLSPSAWRITGGRAS